MTSKPTGWRRLFRLTNNRVRLGVGLVLAVLFCIQCCQPQDPQGESILVATELELGGTTPADLQRLETLAEKDPAALLEKALQRYRRNVHTYTCTFIKQERINGKLKPEQWMEVKFREEPFSVAMAWVKNTPLGDRVLYVEDKYNGMMLIRPAGIWKFLGTQMRAPESPQVMANTLRPITMFGFRRGLESLLEVYRLAQQRGECEHRVEGIVNVDGRQVLKMTRLLPPRKDYPAKRTVIYLDAEHLVPVGVEGFDWDDELICRYIYRDVNFGADLTAEDFTPKSNGMQPPKLK